MRTIFRDGIMGFAVGDALGAPAEFGERWMRDMDPIREMRGGGVFDVPAGGWTDDTSMTIATLESLKNGFDPDDMMDRYLSWYRTGEYSWCGKPIGVGQQILRALERYEQLRDVNACGGKTEMDNGNGALMRMLPICLYGWVRQKRGEMSEDAVLAMIRQASGLTHAHSRSLIASGLYYFIVCSMLHEQGSLTERMQAGLDRGFQYYGADEEWKYFDRLKDVSVLRTLEREAIASSGYVVDTLEAAVWCLLTTDNFRDCLLKAVNLGLDTDTIAALAGGLAGLYYGYERVPQEWLEILKNRGELEQLCRWFDRYAEGDDGSPVQT